MSEILTLHTPTDKALSKLLRNIEALAEGRISHSAGALTERGNPHVAFVNGRRYAEGEAYAGRDLPIEERLDDTLKAVSDYRANIDGRADLVWRRVPEITPAGDLYVQLCFQPELHQVAPGIWVETRVLNRAAGPSDYYG